MHQKIKYVIPSRMELIEKTIQRKGIDPDQTGFGKGMPHQMDVPQAFDVRIVEDKIMVIKDKSKLECLAIDQKPQKDEAKAS